MEQNKPNIRFICPIYLTFLFVDAPLLFIVFTLSFLAMISLIKITPLIVPFWIVSLEIAYDFSDLLQGDFGD